VGTRHILFPRSTGIGRPIPPVEWFRLPVPRRRADQARTISPVFPAPRRSRPTVSPPPACRVRLLGPAAVRLQRAPGSGLRWKTPLGAVPSFLDFPRSASRPMFASRSFAPEDGSCLLPLTLRFHSQTDDSVSGTSRMFGPYRPGPGHHPAGCLPAAGLSPRRVDPFLALTGCDAGGLRSFLVRPKPRDSIPTTLAHSSNDRSATDCVRDSPCFNLKDLA